MHYNRCILSLYRWQIVSYSDRITFPWLSVYYYLLTICRIVAAVLVVVVVVVATASVVRRSSSTRPAVNFCGRLRAGSTPSARTEQWKFGIPSAPLPIPSHSHCKPHDSPPPKVAAHPAPSSRKHESSPLRTSHRRDFVRRPSARYSFRPSLQPTSTATARSSFLASRLPPPPLQPSFIFFNLNFHLIHPYPHPTHHYHPRSLGCNWRLWEWSTAAEVQYRVDKKKTKRKYIL